MNREIYLDNNATTKPLPEVCAAVIEAMGDGFGNPSSAHVAGDRGRDFLRNARQAVAQLIGAEPEGIVFTSSGTEANNMALLSALQRRPPKQCRIVTTATEHSSILRMLEYLEAQGSQIVVLPVDSQGLVDVELLQRELTAETSLVSVQWANNETGVIQPIQAIGSMCQDRGVLFHTDACQAVGEIANASRPNAGRFSYTDGPQDSWSSRSRRPLCP